MKYEAGRIGESCKNAKYGEIMRKVQVKSYPTIILHILAFEISNKTSALMPLILCNAFQL